MSTLSKSLMLLFIALCLALGSLWFIGGKKREYSTTIAINAAPEIVFPYLTDAELMKRWVPGLVSVEPITETRLEVGSKTKSIFEQDGVRVEYEDEILRFQENEEGGWVLSVCARSDNEVSTSIYRLEGDQGTTSLNYKIKSTPTGIGRMLVPFSEDRTQQRIDDDAVKLKQLIEQENPGDVSGNQFDEEPTISAGEDE